MPIRFISIFRYIDYRDFLRDQLTARGGQARLARHLNCQSSHISQVLSGSTNLATEQALPIAAFLGLGRAEAAYLLDLIHYDRAGNAELKTHYRRVLADRQRGHEELRERLKVTETLSEQHQARCYSSWLYVAVHVMTSVKQWQTPAAIASQLKVSLRRVQECLDFLVEIGLVNHDGAGTYEISNRHIHLGKESPLLAQHHRNWRLRAVTSVDEPAPEDLHYSTVVSLSKADLPRLRALLLQNIADQQELIRTSGEEVAVCVNMDLFSL